MKRYARVVSVLIACVLTAGIAQGQQEQDNAGRRGKRKAAGKPKTQLRGDYAQMSKELGLDEGQQARLTAIAQQEQAAVKAWQEANKQKLEALDAEFKQAREDKDREKLRSVAGQRTEMKTQMEKVTQPFQAQAQALLTAQQKQKWQGYLVYRNVTGKLRRCKLTEQQQEQIREMAGKVSAETKDPAEAEKQLMAKATEILTEEQRQKMPKARPSQGRSKPAAGDKPDRKAKAGRKAPRQSRDQADDEGDPDSFED